VSHPRLVEVGVFTDRPEEVDRFYGLVLESSPNSEWPGGATYAAGDVTILIHVRGAELPGGPANRDHVAFGVDDLDEACARLREQGVEIEIEPRTFPWGRSAYIRDPDGRLVELAER
jgi:catechol 2,3-dioxygenase-like lactoylglutathione lyase family enzyme